jgi:hypothetical protein
MENIIKIKEYIRESQELYPREKIESELIDNLGIVTKEELDSIYDNVIKSKKKSDQGNNLFFFMIFIFIFGLPFIGFIANFILIGLFVYILKLGHSARTIDKDNNSSKNLLIGTYIILIFVIIANLILYLL